MILLPVRFPAFLRNGARRNDSAAENRRSIEDGHSMLCPYNNVSIMASRIKPESKSVIRVGPAGWSYADWAGYVYPSRRRKGFHEATYLAEFFDTIEINTSFYNPIRPEHAAQWIERVAENPRFVFTAKLWQRFTHDTVPHATPANSSPGASSGLASASAEDERLVRAGFDVLRGAGKLGAV